MVLMGAESILELSILDRTYWMPNETCKECYDCKSVSIGVAFQLMNLIDVFGVM
jgi:hypothetical protein